MHGLRSLPKTLPGTLRPLYRISNGDIDGDSSTRLTENGRPWGRAAPCMRTSAKWDKADIPTGVAGFTLPPDNSNPNTNGRKYILRTTTSARGYIYEHIRCCSRAGSSVLFTCGKENWHYTELWPIGQGYRRNYGAPQKHGASVARKTKPILDRLYQSSASRIFRALPAPLLFPRPCLAVITPKHRVFIYFAGAGFAGLASLLFFLWIKKLTFSEFFRETIAGLQRRKRAWHEALQRDRANFAFETFVWTHFLYGLGMFLLAFVLLSTLWPPFFEATFEADTAHSESADISGHIFRKNRYRRYPVAS